MTKMMKALVKTKPAVGLWMERVPVPEVGPNDVLIKVKKSAICGTDVHIWNWDQWAQKTIPVPMVVGHEFMGEIAAVGSAVTKYHVGERVSRHRLLLPGGAKGPGAHPHADVGRPQRKRRAPGDRRIRRGRPRARCDQVSVELCSSP
ncbi:hypothetical protein ASE47_33435 [Ensifer sp. Root258]|nr:hypothetical protein ASE47_33435 [Ensifer sp. Root258]